MFHVKHCVQTDAFRLLQQRTEAKGDFVLEAGTHAGPSELVSRWARNDSDQARSLKFAPAASPTA